MQTHPSKHQHPSRSLRVLLIDDCETEYVLTREMLNSVHQGPFKYELVWEPNGDRAKQWMMENRFDLYLLDYHIGPWNGIDLLRETISHCENPVIMLTEHDQFEVDDEAMTLGASDFVLKKDLSPSKIERVIRHAKQRKHKLDTLKQQAFRDELTRLCNRREFNQQLQHHLASAERHQHDLCLCLADIDHFKNVNDRFGHAAGDAALIHFARMIQNTVRGEDIVARFGGDEFAIIFPHIDAHGAYASTERIRHLIETQPVRHDGEHFQIQCSFGIARYRTGMDEAQLLSVADEALYQAKALGRNQCFVHAKPEQQAQARHQKNH